MSKSIQTTTAEPPVFCEYAGGPCDQKIDTADISDGLFLYSSSPEIIANTIEESIKKCQEINVKERWNSWKNLKVSGQIIFCEICKAIRYTKVIVADVTTLNFNLLFEIGFALGLTNRSVRSEIPAIFATKEYLMN